MKTFKEKVADLKKAAEACEKGNWSGYVGTSVNVIFAKVRNYISCESGERGAWNDATYVGAADPQLILQMIAALEKVETLDGRGQSALVSAVESQIEGLHKQIDQLKTDLEAARTERELLSNDYKALSQDYVVLKDERDKHEVALKASNSRVEHLKEELQVLRFRAGLDK